MKSKIPLPYFLKTQLIRINRYRVERVLSRPNRKTSFFDDDLTFWKLYNNYQPRDTYKYDAFNLWERATARFLHLLKLSQLSECNNAQVLEVGSGDGTLAYLFQCYGFNPITVDMEDWRARWAARHTPLIRSNLQIPLTLDSNKFDLVFSYNTFEHLTHPRTAWDEMLRVCKPGGYLYLSFGPLFASAWGLHAYKTIGIPYIQYLFSRPFILEKFNRLGIRDLGKERTELQPLNEWKLNQFQALWRTSECEIVSETFTLDSSHLSFIRQFSSAFQGRDLTFEDVVTKSVHVLLRKRDLYGAI